MGNSSKKGTLTWDFRPSVFNNQTPLGPWFTGQSRFAYGFEFAEKFDSEIDKIGFRGVNQTAEADFFSWSSPLTFMFSSNYKYVMFQYVQYLFLL
jgi:hypothetical protein